MTNRHKETRYIVTVPLKSVGISLILTLLFGPIGMFYSTIWGGLIMTPICFALGFLLGQVGFMLIWPICIVWGALAVSGSNKRILAKAAID